MKTLKTVIISALTTLAFAAQVQAMDLQSAKQQGLVGELANGYIGAVVNSSQAKAIARDINVQRQQAYQAISKENGQPISVVEALAAKKLYNKLNQGEYYQSSEGSWKAK